MNKKYEILSLFTGGGLMDIGFMNQDFQVAKAVEINNDFIYANNYAINRYVNSNNNISVTHHEISNAIDISLYHEQNKLASDYFNLTGIIGGPPCQDYSIGGKNKGSKGDKGKLIYSYYLTVKKVQPEFIFFENVSGLRTTRNHALAFYDLREKIEKEGYNTWFTILNALDYGVPQDRSRIALVGFKKKIVRKLIEGGYQFIDSKVTPDKLIFRWPKKRFSDPKSIKWPSTWQFDSPANYYQVDKIPERYKGLTVHDAFKGLTNKSHNQLEFFIPYSDRFLEIAEGDTGRKSFKRLHRYRFSPTVAYGNNEVHLHPTEPRRISVREALRLQSVPDSYVLPKDLPLSDKFKLISNGVPTKLANLIACEIKRTLNNYYKL